MKKLNILDVRDYVVANSKCELISNRYINSTTPLLFKCSCGNIFEKSLNKFKNGQRQCTKCGFNNSKEKCKNSFDYVKDYIENLSNSNCILLSASNDYINNRSILKIKCACGNEFNTTFHDFYSSRNKKRQCSICGNKIKSKKLSINYHDIKDYVNGDNGNSCELITSEKDYKNTTSKIKVKCYCGNIFETTFSQFKLKNNAINMCEICRLKEFQNKMCRPYHEVYQFFKEQGCILLTSEKEYWEIKYNKNDIVNYICLCGNKSSISIMKFLYGHRCYNCLNNRKIQTNLSSFGYEYVACSPEKLAQMKQTLYKNGTAPCSKQQTYLHNLYGGELNYPVKTLSLDIAFPQEMIYLEYDGGMHNGQVIFGNLTQEEFNKKERNRSYALYRSGWKSIRIISNKDYLPSDNVLLNMMDYAKQYLEDHHYIKFDIDNSTVITSKSILPFDYGELRQIRNNNVNNNISLINEEEVLSNNI